ncbi:hypothetical protein J6590_022734 [Homalodisca vitripennis]|nr:hypothetical protein J6590_022734 [Homalodisca vitripennis]
MATRPAVPEPNLCESRSTRTGRKLRGSLKQDKVGSAQTSRLATLGMGTLGRDHTPAVYVYSTCGDDVMMTSFTPPRVTGPNSPIYPALSLSKVIQPGYFRHVTVQAVTRIISPGETRAMEIERCNRLYHLSCIICVMT